MKTETNKLKKPTLKQTPEMPASTQPSLNRQQTY